jgi:transcriptional regulator with XRE-family HTH domain
MYQKDVAAIVNATTSTVANWEKGCTNPTLVFIPRILEFLGYEPFPTLATSISEKIKQYQRKNGLSLKNLAKELDVDPSTLARWEKSETIPSKKLNRKLAALT